MVSDFHQCPDVKFELIYEYGYGLLGDVNEFGYTIVDIERNGFTKVVYTPVKVKCDPLQTALIMIYSRDVYADNLGSFSSITVRFAM